MPSPIIPTRRPAACNSLITFSLPSGNTSAITSSMPALLAMASAVRRLSPLSMITRKPSWRSSFTTPAVSGRMVSATASIPTRRPFTASKRGVAPESDSSAKRASRSFTASKETCRSSISRLLPSNNGMDSFFSRSTLPDTPRPETLAKSLTGYRWRFRSSAADVTASARGCSDTPSSEAAYPKMRSSSNSGSKDSAASRRGLPSVNVPVLSNTSNIQTAREFEGRTVLDEHAHLRAPARGHHNGNGRGKADAHGQATTSTATKIRKASETGTCPQYSHPAPAMTASAMTVGTKMRLTSSASRAMGALSSALRAPA